MWRSRSLLSARPPFHRRMAVLLNDLRETCNEIWTFIWCQCAWDHTRVVQRKSENAFGRIYIQMMCSVSKCICRKYISGQILHHLSGCVETALNLFVLLCAHASPLPLSLSQPPARLSLRRTYIIWQNVSVKNLSSFFPRSINCIRISLSCCHCHWLAAVCAGVLCALLLPLLSTTRLLAAHNWHKFRMHKTSY